MWIAGCWSGQLVHATDGATEALLFSLALLPVAFSPPPTLIGASLPAAGARGASLLSPCGGPPPTSPLSFTFSEASTGRVFTGTLALHPSPNLRGTWRGGGGDGGGAFGLVLEEASDAVAGGVFLGESAPAPELAEFYFPTNPIFWVASVARGRLFGAGFFSDAGDVAGSPVLLFTLSGEGAPGAPVRFEKAYAGLGEDSNVVYEGVMERGCLCCAGGGGGGGGGGAPCALSTWVLRGKWANPAAGSRGPFSAALVPPAAALPPPFHTRPPPLCALCGAAPAAGAALWACTAAAGACGGAPWAVCAGCHVSDLAAAHPHALAPRLATPWVDPLPALLAAAARGARVRRAVFGLAGEPGSGKSTLAAALVAAVNAREGAGAAVALSMDGFHLPRAALDAGLPPAHPAAAECHARRGAPWTFAPAALEARLRAVVAGGGGGGLAGL